MRTSKNYQNILSLFKDESERLRKNAHNAEEPETLYYYSHLHLYLCALCADIATVTLNTHEKTLFLKHVQECSSQMCAEIGNQHIRHFEKSLI